MKRKLLSLFGHVQLNSINRRVQNIESIVNHIQVENYLNKHLFNNPKYSNSKRLTKHFNKYYCKNGIEGMIEELILRIGKENATFIEFGVHSFRNNTTFLLNNDWSGTWIEGDHSVFKKFHKKLRTFHIENLTYIKGMISYENVNEYFSKNIGNTNVDLISIDIDGQDYYVWEALDIYAPRVVIIEYNASLGSKLSLVVPRSKNLLWNGTSYFGASLEALVNLGNKKGYVLVGCDFAGCNAIFLRKDLVNESFEQNFSSDFHYEPPRYFVQLDSGHPPSFGPYVTV